jgi:hypothetical protein
MKSHLINKLFSVLEEPISYLFGGSKVSFSKEMSRRTGELQLFKELKLNKQKYFFSIKRPKVTFTKSEKILFEELSKALVVLYTGFNQSAYQAHIRSAITASLLDISIARFFRESRPNILGPIQNLFQTLKKLSFERYEGSPATTGIIITKKFPKQFHDEVVSRGFEIVKFSSKYQIDDSFFEGPLAYRYINGSHSFYVAKISKKWARIKITNLLRKPEMANYDAIDRLSYCELFKIITTNSTDNFAAILNSNSEIEILFGERKIFLWRKGKWSIFDPDIFHEFFGDNLENKDIEAIIWALYALSKVRHGTLMLIGEIDDNQAGRLKKGSVAGKHSLSQELIENIKTKSILELKNNGDLLRILSSDGLTIINTDGNIIDTGVITDTSIISRKNVTGGGRTTAAIAASNFGKVIKVSEDGPIEFYVNEQRLYRFG